MQFFNIMIDIFFKKNTHISVLTNEDTTLIWKTLCSSNKTFPIKHSFHDPINLILLFERYSAASS